MLLWYSNPINFILAREGLHQSFSNIWQKSQFPAIQCPYWQEKFRTSIASPWRDTKKPWFPGTIRKVNLGIIFQITILPTSVGSLPKPSHQGMTPTFPDLWPCAVPRARPSLMPQQGDLFLSLWFPLPPGACGCWDMLHSMGADHQTQTFTPGHSLLFVARMRLPQYFGGARQLHQERRKIKGIAHTLNVL